MEKNTYLWQANSAEQNNLLVAEFFRSQNHQGLELMLADGFPLNSYVLSMMVVNRYSAAAIKSFILKAFSVSDTAKLWISEHFEAEEISDIYISHPEWATSDFPTDEECEQFKLWEVLFNREKYELVVSHIPERLVEKNSYSAWIALLQYDFDKYAPLLLERHGMWAIVSCDSGWKYLAEHGYVEWLLDNAHHGKNLSEKEIVAYCLKNGFIEELYNAGMFEVLLENEQFEIFIQKHSLNSLFIEKYPERVDWEDLWNRNGTCVKDALMREAFKHPEVKKCYDFLWKHGNMRAKLKLLMRK